jgi:hypothetical protein
MTNIIALIDYNIYIYIYIFDNNYSDTINFFYEILNILYY